MKQVAVFETQMKFAEVVDILRPLAESNNAQVELSLANAYLNLAINGRTPDAVSDAAALAVAAAHDKTLGPITREKIQPAIDFAERAARHGSAGGFNILYIIYANGFGVEADIPKAIGYLKRASAGGDLGAKYNYAVMLYEGGAFLKQDVSEACILFDELGRDPATMNLSAYYLGQIVYRGQCGHKADKVEGMKLVRIGARAGVRQAERDMGKSFDFGWLGQVDRKMALSWYQKAADHGDPFSEWRIGMAYVNGEMGPKDSAKGVSYLQHSAESDFPQGLTDLGVMYAIGDGVAKDVYKARVLYERAAQLGEPHAFKELAAMYANGEGVPVDKLHARVLCLQSVAMGESESAAPCKALAKNLTVGQLEQSDREFSEWQKQKTAK